MRREFPSNGSRQGAPLPGRGPPPRPGVTANSSDLLQRLRMRSDSVPIDWLSKLIANN
jgi:hypothetical protein